jgi:signal transduction histidine kinase
MLAKKYFGLAGMLERAKLIGAKIEITSKPMEGTRVIVIWTLDTTKDEN